MAGKEKQPTLVGPSTHHQPFGLPDRQQGSWGQAWQGHAVDGDALVSLVIWAACPAGFQQQHGPAWTHHASSCELFPLKLIHSIGIGPPLALALTASAKHNQCASACRDCDQADGLLTASLCNPTPSPGDVQRLEYPTCQPADQLENQYSTGISGHEYNRYPTEATAPPTSSRPYCNNPITSSNGAQEMPNRQAADQHQASGTGHQRPTPCS